MSPDNSTVGVSRSAREAGLPSALAAAAYGAVMNGLFPLATLLASPVLALKRKRRGTLLPRLGFQPYPEFAPGTPAPVWVHALSVGELLCVVPFLRALRPRLGKRPLVVSVSTLAARELAEARLKGGVDALVYFPYDTALAYRRCLARIRPALFVLVETDLWPGYPLHFRRRKVPCWLINGRLSPRSFASRRRWWCLFGPALACFERIHGQSAAENARFAELGVDPALLGQPGNLKFDACGLPPTPEAVVALRTELGYAPADRILIAGSTHPGEEAIVSEAFLALRQEFPALRLIAVPRHPARGQEVRQIFAATGLTTGLIAERPAVAPDVRIVDAIGHLGRLYSLAEIAVVGGSLIPHGGQNPIEPAMAGKPVLFGPHMHAFPDIAPALLGAGGAFTVRNAAELIAEAGALLRDPGRAAGAGARGKAVVSAHAGITDHLVAQVVDRLQAGSLPRP